MVWGTFSRHTLGPLVPIEHRLNATAYLSIVADHVLTIMTTHGKKLTVLFSTHGSAHSRTAVQLKSDNASSILFVISNT